MKNITSRLCICSWEHCEWWSPLILEARDQLPPVSDWESKAALEKTSPPQGESWMVLRLAAALTCFVAVITLLAWPGQVRVPPRGTTMQMAWPSRWDGWHVTGLVWIPYWYRHSSKKAGDCVEAGHRASIHVPLPTYKRVHVLRSNHIMWLGCGLQINGTTWVIMNHKCLLYIKIEAKLKNTKRNVSAVSTIKGQTLVEMLLV